MAKRTTSKSKGSKPINWPLAVGIAGVAGGAAYLLMSRRASANPQQTAAALAQATARAQIAAPVRATTNTTPPGHPSWHGLPAGDTRVTSIQQQISAAAPPCITTVDGKFGPGTEAALYCLGDMAQAAEGRNRPDYYDAEIARLIHNLPGEIGQLVTWVNAKAPVVRAARAAAGPTTDPNLAGWPTPVGAWTD